LNPLIEGGGFWEFWGRILNSLLTGRFWFVVVLQATLFLPFALRVLAPISQVMQIQELEAATALGVGPVSAFWDVEWPRWKEPVTRVCQLP
jgi:ABC-type Fe3+ transport system permease subunit